MMKSGLTCPVHPVDGQWAVLLERFQYKGRESSFLVPQRRRPTIQGSNWMEWTSGGRARDHVLVANSNSIMVIPHVIGSGTPAMDPQSLGFILGLITATTRRIFCAESSRVSPWKCGSTLSASLLAVCRSTASMCGEALRRAKQPSTCEELLSVAGSLPLRSNRSPLPETSSHSKIAREVLSSHCPRGPSIASSHCHTRGVCEATSHSTIDNVAGGNSAGGVRVNL